MEEQVISTVENVVIDYSEQLTEIIDKMNYILSVDFVFMNVFILFCICSLIYLFLKNF